MKRTLRTYSVFGVSFCPVAGVTVFAAIALWMAAAAAGDAELAVPELNQARNVYETRLAAISEKTAETLAQLTQRYAAVLEQLKVSLREDGDLQELLDVHDEVHRFHNDPLSSVEDLSPLPVSVRHVWEALASHRENAVAQEATRTLHLTQRYLEHLHGIRDDLTRQNRQADAMLVDAEITQTRRNLARLVPDQDIPEEGSTEQAPTAADVARRLAEDRAADRRGASREPDGQPPAVSMRVKRLSSVRDVDTRWETRWGSYSRDLSSRIAVEVDLFNMRSDPADLMIETLFVARPSSGSERWIFDRQTERIKLDQNFNTVVISKPLTASVSFYRFSRTRRTTGDRIEGYIIRVLHGGDVLQVESSSHPLRRIGEDAAALDAIMPR